MNRTMIQMTLDAIQACATSIAHPTNIVDVTPEHYARLEALYEELLDLQQEIACGRSTHVPLQPTRPIYTKRKR